MMIFKPDFFVVQDHHEKIWLSSGKWCIKNVVSEAILRSPWKAISFCLILETKGAG